MKIIFFGLYGTFSFTQIGGTDSFVRRLTFSLIKNYHNLNIEYVFYNANSNVVTNPYPHLTIRNYKKMKDALGYFTEIKPDHVVTCYIKFKNRFEYARFREKSKFTIFHKIEFFFPEFFLKRCFKSFEMSITPYNGKIFCVSPRIYDYLKEKFHNTLLLLPPVPKSYFVDKNSKKNENKIQLTFLGRIDPRKGILETIELFNKLSCEPSFDCKIYGILIPEDKKAMSVHYALASQKKIQYFEIDRQNHSKKIDNMVQNILKSTDIFVQPYINLESTVDTPLLLIEAMASLCTILTTPVGNIEELYGNSQFILPANYFSDYAYKILKNISANDLKSERDRIWGKIQSMNIQTNKASNNFINAIVN